MSEPSAAESLSTTPIRVDGRYVLRTELGRGGMATVYRAWDTVLDREVAVKVLHEHLATDPAFLERFRREARAAAALSHPHVVGVHDWGQTEQGAYLVLQLVDGPSLRDVLVDRGRLGAAETLGVLHPAAMGLAAAHMAGLVHRDVKPENLLLGYDGLVRVADFGLARAAASATTTFGSDVLVGSPHYLSPEAVLGHALDPRADVYGLGIVLFECLTGRPPHEGDTPYATAVAHTTRPVPAPSSWLPGVPRAVDDVVLTATAIDRDDRFPDAAAFAAALRAAVPTGVVPLDLAAVRRPGTGPPPRPDETARREQDRSGGGNTWIDPDVHGGDDPARSDDNGLGRGEDGDERWMTAAEGPSRGTQATGSLRRGLIGLAVVLALLAASVGAGYLLWDRVVAPIAAVPLVVGNPGVDAQGVLEHHGFEVVVAETRPHDPTVPEDHVLEQLPVREARRGSAVTLVLSGGPAPITMPEVTDLRVADAVAELEALGFEVVVERRAGIRSWFRPDRVIAQEPAPGVVHLDGATVRLEAYQR